MIFRIDIVGLDEETKPTTGIENGTTYYTVDSHKLFIWYEGDWYDQEEEFTPPDDQDEGGDDDQGGDDTPPADDPPEENNNESKQASEPKIEEPEEPTEPEELK